MQANRRRDTRPEVAIRSMLHARGLRFRIDRPIPVRQGRPIRPDLVFSASRVAVFVDGCFWHGCPVHGTSPKTNADYWLSKIAENRRRDARNSASLEAEGWIVIRAWAHEPPQDVVTRVAAAIDRAKQSAGNRRPQT
jgi:DNA mismatch endonuclease (patch repair protein)